jgi:hypothetical protein
LTASPGFTWANVTAYTIELLTTADGEAPDSVYLDKWSACRMTNAPYKDQDWGVPGPSHAPWGDAEDTNGGFHSWALMADAYTGYPTNSLKLSGADRNTNNYVGGNGFFTRPEDRDWSVSSHIALLARNGGDTNKADPLLRLELIDSGSRTASASEVVSASLYSRVLMARSNMTVDTGFVWTNVQEVKLHMLTGTPGVDPNDVYLKEIQIGSISNQTPVDWSPFNGIEMYVRRAELRGLGAAGCHGSGMVPVAGPLQRNVGIARIPVDEYHGADFGDADQRSREDSGGAVHRQVELGQPDERAVCRPGLVAAGDEQRGVER